jgi:transcriptional regulator of acetoin/glycerol metabolism
VDIAPEEGTPPVAPASQAPRGEGSSLREVAGHAAQEAERRALEEALVEESWNVTRTARRLGISRTTLQERIKRYGLRRPG